MAVAELVVKLIGDVSGFAKSMSQVGKDVSKTGKDLTKAGAFLTKAITAPLVGLGTASLMAASDFQSGMSKVSALGEITGESLKKLEDQALKLGASTQFSATEAANGMAELAAAGFKAEEIYDAMPGVLDLAAAGQLSVARAAEVSAATLQQFNLKASDASYVADLLARSAAEGAVSVDDIAQSMKYVGPVAQATGQSLRETVSAITVLSNVGIKADQAGTALRMGLIRMVKPTKQAQDAIDKYGLQLLDASGKVRPITEVIDELGRKQISLADLTKLVGVEAASAWQGLVTKGAPALVEMNTKLNDVEGAAAQMAATLRDNLAGSWEEMTGAIETVAIAIGNALTPAARLIMGVVRDAADGVLDLVQAFRGLNQDTQNAAIAFLGVVAAAGPVVLAIGTMTKIVGAAITKIGGMKTAIALLTSAGGIGLIAVAVGAAVGAVVYFKDEVADAFTWVSGFVADTFDTIVYYASEWGSRLWDVTVAAFDLMIVAVDGFLSLFGVSLEDVALVWQGVWLNATETFEAFCDVASSLWRDFGNGLSVIGEGIGNAWAATMNYIKSIFADAFDTILAGLQHAKDVIGAFSESGARAIDRLYMAMEDLRRPIPRLESDVKKLSTATDTLGDKTDDAKKATAELTKRIKEQQNPTNDLRRGVDELGKANTRAETATKRKTQAEREAEKAEKDRKRAIEDLASDIEKLVTSSERYKEILDGVANGSISASSQAQVLLDLYEEGRTILLDYKQASIEYFDVVTAIAKGESVLADEVARVTENYEKAKKAKDNFEKNGPGGGGVQVPTSSTGIFGSDFTLGMFSTVLGYISQAKGYYDEALAENPNANKGQEFASATGRTVAAFWTAGLSEMIRGIIGADTWRSMEELSFGFQAIGHMFGEAQGTAIRKELDKYIADILKDNPVQAIIDGVMQPITDLQFTGNFEGGIFDTLDQEAQAAFDGIAMGFQGLIGVVDTFGINLSNVLANNLGGSLNNLQLFVQSTGKSFEELSGIVVETFLDGKISALEAQTALNGIAQVAQDGIPDGVGFTVKAFENLKAAGTKGGRALIDALKDIGFEAKELGIKDIPSLMQNLVASGELTQEEVGQVFATLKEHGIDSIDALVTATDQQLIGVLSQLQSQNFPFADAVQDAADLVETIDDLPSKKEITFKIRTEMDSNTKNAIDAGFVPNVSGGGTTTVPVRPNATGNVFAAGSLIPFAKGGVVGRPTLFNMGLMGERGPEAIMPLERMPDGRLGVLSPANSESRSESVNVTINAPYAQPGVAETIRREIDKYFDRRNRYPGIRR